MAIPLIAPSTSPSSKAFVVPSACDDVHIAVPAATGFFIRNNFIKTGENMAPSIPVNISEITVIAETPP